MSWTEPIGPELTVYEGRRLFVGPFEIYLSAISTYAHGDLGYLDYSATLL
jgi:hypothetical protein